ncbi:MAG: DUF3127 domain-containing protein [Bacteroidaceae bacterium]
MEIKGTIVTVLPVESGISQNTGNEWKRQTVILATEGQYPKNVAIILGKDLIGTIVVGETLDISINIESREYKEKWYTSISGWKISRPQAQPYSYPAGAYPPAPPYQAYPYPQQPQQPQAPCHSPVPVPSPAQTQAYAPSPQFPTTDTYVTLSATELETKNGDLPF